MTLNPLTAYKRWRDNKNDGIPKRPLRIRIKARPGRSLAGNVGIFIMLSVIGLFMLLPLVFTILQAFKPMDELFMFPPRFWVSNPTLENFRNLTVLLGDSAVPISRYFLNTVFIMLCTTIGHVLVASMAAYVLEKRNFPGKNFLFQTVILSLMFSGSVTGIPGYLILSKLGFIDTYWAIVIPGLGSTLGLYLMKQFMSNVPNSLLESARIDGAREFHIFRSIVMPMVKPAWLTLVILLFQTTWSTTGTGVIFSEQLKPFNYAIGQILSAGISRSGAGAAVTFIMMGVPLAVFIITQSNVIETMASSGIKE